MYDGIVQDLIDELGRLPGVGPKSAQRIAFHIIQTETFDVDRLATILQTVRERVRFCVSDATALPFATAAFDAAYHFGGLNLFPDIRRGIAEMTRVVKPGGRVVFGDEGVAPWLVDSQFGKILVNL